MIAIAPIRLCCRSESPLSHVKNKVLLFLFIYLFIFFFFFATTALSSKMIEQNLTRVGKDFSQYIMVLKICSLKYFGQCI